jgi:hypothetical protein
MQFPRGLSPRGISTTLFREINNAYADSEQAGRQAARVVEPLAEIIRKGEGAES